MEHSEFQIGLEFWCGKRRWRCTDVGTRTVVAIRVHPVEMTTVQAGGTKEHETPTYEQADAMAWFDGPRLEWPRWFSTKTISKSARLRGRTYEPGSEPDR